MRERLGWTRGGLALSLMVLTSACGDSTGPVDDNGEALCSVPAELLWTSLPPDAIPALTLPDMVGADTEEARYLFDFDRILGIVVDGEARAYPHNILWHHEIVNDRIGDKWVTVSFCPLTGSGLAFDPHVGGSRLDLGVSGLLFANNLVMFDRISGSVYGPQLAVDGKCGSFKQATLDIIPIQEMSWGRWKELYPETTVVTGNTGFPRNYRAYPYGTYDAIDSSDLLFPMSVDETRPIKERVLAIRIGDGGRGYPFGELSDLGDVSVLNESVGGVPTTVFYEARDGETATAWDARVAGQTLTFVVGPGDVWQDEQTGSTWSIGGTALDGPLAGEQLLQRDDSFVVMWFAWKHFQPNGETYGQ